jgi:hypothetical protein
VRAVESLIDEEEKFVEKVASEWEKGNEKKEQPVQGIGHTLLIFSTLVTL